MLRAPDQSPLAEQLFALLLLQLSVTLSPASTLPAEVVKLSVGGSTGSGVTVTLTLSLAEPPAPLQLNMKVVFVCRGPTLAVPLPARAPLQPPEAEQLDASVDDQLNTTLAPAVICDALVLRVTVGASGTGCPATVTATELLVTPPTPKQVRV